MSSITINLEIGHEASLREKTTTEGFTHDWEVFVRGSNGADIRHYVDRVVFHLHETFEKPKRVIKDPPYSVKTSGYAGFNLPIQVYLKNSLEPRKIQFNYDLRLQPSGPPIHEIQKEKYTFYSVNEDFRNKLLKGGAVVGSGSSSTENSVNYSSKSDDKAQMTSKPKLSGSEQPKKYKLKPEEPRSDQFTNLFGTPITKTSRVDVPKTKEPPKPVVKLSDKDKGDKSIDKDKTKKSPYKEKDKDKDRDKSTNKEKEKQTDNSNIDRKSKDEKKEKREKKDREHSKKDKKERRDREKEKEKEKERERSPKPKSPSPKRSPKRPRSPSPVKIVNKEREPVKEKEPKESRDKEKEKKSKKHKEKESKHRDRDKEKERDRDRDRSSEHKEFKNRENKANKEKDNSSSSNGTIVSASSKEKERESSPIVNTQPQKSEKKEKFKEKDDKLEESPKLKDKEKSDDKPKHKHKKKDKDRKEKKEKDREEKAHKKDKEEKKFEKEKFSVMNFVKEISSKERDKTDLFGSSPKSEPSPSPPPTEIEPEKLVAPLMDDDSSNASKISSREPSPVPEPLPPAPPPRSPSPPPLQDLPTKSSTPEEAHIGKKSREADTPVKKKDKKERKKDKKSDKDHEKKRKRKVEAETQVEIEQPPVKMEKIEEDTNNNSDDERKVSSTEDANPLPYSDDGEAYMSMLRDLQTKIMGLKDNSDLQKVVQLIAETGKYEVSAHTFDFDLCLLDRSTVMQLQSFFSSVN